MFECQLVPWDVVKHLPAKWCLVTAVKRDDTVDGTCCPRERAKGTRIRTFVLFITLLITGVVILGTVKH